jgi:hypothetical protein
MSLASIWVGGGEFGDCGGEGGASTVWLMYARFSASSAGGGVVDLGVVRLLAGCCGPDG